MLDSISIEKNQNNVQAVKDSTAQVSPSNTTNTIFNSTADTQGNVDTANTSNTSNVNTQKRSADELYNAIAGLCSQYGISIAEAKKAKLMERIAGVEIERLVKYSNSEIQKQIECLKAALEKIAQNSKEIDLEAVIKQANDYHIATVTGWSIKGFEKRNASNSDDINERLGKFLGETNFDLCKLSREEQIEKLDDYFNKYFQRLIDDGMSPEEAAKLQLQDFGKLLINTADEDKEPFKIAFASVLSKNKNSALHALVESFKTQEGKNAFFDTFSADDLERATEVDITGESISSEQTTDIVATVAANQTEKGRVALHNDLNEKATKFFEENKEVLVKVAEKIKNGEELTEEEKAIQNKVEKFYTPAASGEFIGTANNLVISDEFKNEFLKTLNSDAYVNPNYRDVLEQIASYSEKHADSMVMTKEEFDKIMDNSTDGNYTTVVNDTKNGTVSELVAPQQTTTSSKTAVQKNTPAIGFEVKAPVNSKKLETVTSQVLNTEEVSGTKVTHKTSGKSDIVSCAKSGVKAFNEFIEKHGTVKTITEFFSNLNKITGQGLINKTARLYTRLNADKQTNILKQVATSGLNELLKYTPNATLCKLEGETFSNFYATQLINEKAEKAEEKIA